MQNKGGQREMRGGDVAGGKQVRARVNPHARFLTPFGSPLEV